MIRTPLRPLARILHAREIGASPDAIERDNLRERNEALRERARGRAQLRLLFLCMCFFSAFTVVGARMGMLAASEPMEPRSAGAANTITAGRADIVDRNGRVLATNMLTHALYVQTKDLIDPARVARELAVIFPELDPATLERRFTDGRSFLWVRRVMSPEQMQAVHNIGDPGLLFGPREMRLYPNGSLAAHILGGASFGAEGVDRAEVIGTAGVEKALDTRLRDPAQAGTPLELSIDLTVQATVEEVLETGVLQYEAKGGAVILMDVRTGEIAAMASYPSFDPNDRPNPLADPKAEPGDSVLFNRAVQGVYELGSTFKIFAAAQAMELGLVNPDTPVNTQSLSVGRKRFTEFDNKNYGPTKTVSEVMEVSSNIGTGHLALQIGAERQKAFYKALGLLDPSPVELVEAPGARPLVPKKWPDVVTVTASFGHGMSSSPLNLAAAYATLANGGIKVTPTLLRKAEPMVGPRVVSEQVAMDSVAMLRRVVTNGTASMAKMDAYAIGGKTGTADKPKRGGGYYEDKVITTFAAVFPTEAPKYVLLVTLDEPMDRTGPEVRRTAGWTAVPVAAEIVRRSAPLLGLRPAIAAPALDGLTAVKQ
ncbi:peptidoglycan D,D-transpeptidase FtsI family protein [Tabrizicola sp.]|uniref:peptidoglycan D,D-transpeptidase FtsI family protein n=1 Tax=Tabrizicola sp. TaxID=2005166 RepID=UPI003D29716D